MRYSERFKEKLVAKTLSGRHSVDEVAEAAGVSRTSLYQWLREAKMGSMSKEKSSRRRQRSPEEKLRIFTEAESLSEETTGAFLRREGLHEAELVEIQREVRELALAALAPRKKAKGPSAEEKKIRRLERELARKDKALAEAGALLVLQKKFHALLEEEGDDTDETSEND